MTNQNKKSELNETIELSGICKAIDSLEIKLNNYQGSQLAFKNRYEIQLELIDLNHSLETMRNQLETLIQQAEKWEALE